jgi:hypothetical protein
VVALGRKLNENRVARGLLLDGVAISNGILQVVTDGEEKILGVVG